MRPGDVALPASTAAQRNSDPDPEAGDKALLPHPPQEKDVLKMAPYVPDERSDRQVTCSRTGTSTFIESYRQMTWQGLTLRFSILGEPHSSQGALLAPKFLEAIRNQI